MYTKTDTPIYRWIVLGQIKQSRTTLISRLKQLVNQESGNIAIYSMASIFVLTLLTGIFLSLKSSQNPNMTPSEYKIQATQLAEAGITKAVEAFKNGVHPSVVLIGHDGRRNTEDDGVFGFGSRIDVDNGNYSVICIDNDDQDGDPFFDSDGSVLLRSTGTVSINGNANANAPVLSEHTTTIVEAYVEVASAMVSGANAIVTVGTLNTVDHRIAEQVVPGVAKPTSSNTTTAMVAKPRRSSAQQSRNRSQSRRNISQQRQTPPDTSVREMEEAQLFSTNQSRGPSLKTGESGVEWGDAD